MSKDGYKCVFSDIECPVRAQFKLKPESLVEFCKVCPTKSKPIATDFTSQITPFLTMLASRDSKQIEIQNKEKLRLMELVESLSKKILEISTIK